ncbi:MAG: hypothetical protein PF541_11700 [Prolixibacteraceae bacterium]|jgi:hypothetical protein|nr:hypothetical protein [Prolixibacteraceae bacterium]
MNYLFNFEPTELFPDASLLTCNRENVLKSLGMKLTDADDYLLNLIEQLTKECIQLASPKANYLFIENPKFNTTTKETSLNEMLFDTGKTITTLLKKSEFVVLFACTIGQNVEHYSKDEMGKGNSLEGYILDLIGSELAESVTDILHNYLEIKVKEYEMGISNRYSPGYCNWPVSDQHKLFSLLGNYNAGISLTESSLMIPVKSVSGILGVGKSIKRLDYKCRICDDEKCILRHQFKH